MGDRKRLMIRVGGLALALLLILAVVWAIMSMRANSRLEGELKAIEEDGGTLILVDMAPGSVPDDENAAVHLAKAFAVIVKPDDALKTALTALESDPAGAAPDQASAVEAWVAGNSEALEHVARAFACSRCKFELDYSNPMSMKLPGLSDIRDAWRLAHARALLDARAGSYGEAFKGVAASLRGAAVCFEEPILIMHMIRVAMLNSSLERLASILDFSAPGPEAAAEIASALDSIDMRKALKSSMAGERCFGASAFKSIESGAGSGVAGMAPAAGSGGNIGKGVFWAAPRFLLRFDKAEYLRRMRRLIELAERPYFEMRADLASESAKKLPWYALVTRITLPGLERCFASSEAAGARIALARVAMALAAFHAEAGSFPEKLEELVPARIASVPVDPFTGNAMIYKRLGAGSCVIYSTGPDGIDNGGKASKGIEDGTDVVWALKIVK